MLYAAQGKSVGYGVFALEALTVLVLMAAALWVFVRIVRPRIGRLGGGRRMSVVEKLPLEPRRSLYIVEIDDETVVLGVGDGGISFVKRLGRADEGGQEVE